MSEPWADLLKIALGLLTGGGIYKLAPMVVASFRAWSGRKTKGERRQERQNTEDRAAIEITDQLRELARDAVAEVRAEIEQERQKTKSQGLQINRLNARVGQLEQVIRDAHLEVPPEVV